MAVELEIHEGAAPTEVLPAFYFDLGNPESYLVAERILQMVPVATEWIPVLGRELPGASIADALDREALTATLAARGLQELRMPDPFPFDSAFAMRAATYAKQIGRAVPFALAAFRQCYAAARGLDVTDNVLIAGSACEMHPTALLKGAELRGTHAALAAATEQAAARGVRAVPAIWVPGDPERVFHGVGSLEDAAVALGALV